MFGGVAVRQAQLRLTEAEPERILAVRQSGQDKEQPLSVRQALPEADTLGMIRLFQASLLCLKCACHHIVPQSFARMAVSLLTEHCVSLRSSRALTPLCCGLCIMQCAQSVLVVACLALVVLLPRLVTVSEECMLSPESQL